MQPAPRGHQVTPQEQIAAIAGMQVEIRHLATSIRGLSGDVRELKDQLGETQNLVSRGRGAWSTVVVLGAVSATALSAGAWVFEHLMKGHLK